ncbi:MAG TPA: nicotinate phosphoribosyltransferase [Rectinemataceae bacterium]|nr:nicotinate phosphoribosyltransferase [Rectinemataceae bacterium]
MQSALFTDFYELTMAQGYWKRAGGSGDGKAVFDVFFRRQPFQGGYSVFAGLEPLLRTLSELRFSDEDLAWLDSQRMFDRGFLDYLSTFRFRGELWSMEEGEVIFPQEPLLRVHADIIEAQIVEGLILNTINYQSLIATKSARVWRAANFGRVMEFGLRRAHGQDGAFSASRAAFIGGAEGSSNSMAGRALGIPVMGTMAHSWVMSFPGEREAFEAYARLYPDKSVFLIDTYDTLKSGIVNAIAAAAPLAASGKRFGVRLDSGDMAYLSREVRRALDAAGHRDAFIVVSNELDEEIIEHLVSDGAPIDLWGVGTHLVTGGNEASFTGVYKLAAVERDGRLEATMKFSDNPEKATNPGVKQVWRLYGTDGFALADLVALEGESVEAGCEIILHHPSTDWRFLKACPERSRPLLQRVMADGVQLGSAPTLAASKQHLREELGRFDASYLRLLNPHGYKVSISTQLRDLKLGFMDRHMR